MKHLFRMLATAAFLTFGLTCAQATVVAPAPATLAPGVHAIIGGEVPGPDNYSFAAGASGNLSVSLIANPAASIIFSSVQLFDTTGGPPVLVNTASPPPPYPNGLDNFHLIFAGLLNTHTYNLKVAFSGTSEGFYSGSLLLNAPLPASLLLLITGFGFLAIVIYRKRQDGLA